MLNTIESPVLRDILLGEKVKVPPGPTSTSIVADEHKCVMARHKSSKRRRERMLGDDVEGGGVECCVEGSPKR